MKISKSTFIWAVSFTLVGLGIVVLLIAPTGIDTPEPSPVQEIYYADNISAAHQQILDRFNREYQGKIRVIPVNLPFSKFSTNERKELLTRALRSKSDRIDVFAVDVIWVPRFARWTMPLTPYFSEEEIQGILPIALKSCYMNGKLYAVPLYTDVGVMYYRRDLISRLANSERIEQKIQNSLTWRELIHLGRRLGQTGRPFYVFPADNYEGLVCSFVEGMANFGKTFLDSTGLHLTVPEAIKTLRLLVDLVNRYRLTPSEAVHFDEVEGYYFAVQHDAYFLRGWPGFLEHNRELLQDYHLLDKIWLAPLPHFSGGKPAFVIGGWNLMISRFSRNKDAALKLVKFFLREDNQKLLHQIGGYIPIQQSVYRDSAFVNSARELQNYRRLLRHGVHRPYFVQYTKISDVLSFYLKQAIAGHLSPQTALQMAQDEIQKQVFSK